jgi:MoaA/NifB/PqqE/SkfB family radical SAM enzyme
MSHSRQLHIENKKKYKELRKIGFAENRESTQKLVGNTAINGWIHDPEAGKQFSVEDNPFPFLFVDLTYRCNMTCNVCYNPVRPIPDMTLEYFTEAISRLPNKIEIRMLGGEPTIHKDFFEFVDTAFKHGHNVYVSSNGKKAASDDLWVKELKTLSNHYPGQKLKIHMDMSGGRAEAGFAGEGNKFYNIIHNEPAYEEKIQALEHYKKWRMGRVTVSAILIRDLNEGVIPDMFSIADMYPGIIREVAFRSQGRIGRYVGNAEPYVTNDWLRLMFEYKTIDRLDFKDVLMAGYMSKKCLGKNCCFHYRQDRKLTVSWLDFLCNTCWLRGQLMEKDFKVEYMFESLQVNDFNILDYSKSGIDQSDYEKAIEKRVYLDIQKNTASF